MAEWIDNLKEAGTEFLVDLKDHAPEIGVIGGCIGVIGGTVLACLATRKLDGVLEEHKAEVERIKNLDELDKKELRKLYLKTTLKIAKLYAIPALIEGASIASIAYGHAERYNRYTNLSAYCASLVAYNKEIRAKLEEKYGEDSDDILLGAKEEVIEEKVVDEKTGKEKTVKKKQKVVDENLTSPYAFYYDERFPGYRGDDLHYDLTVLSARERVGTEYVYTRKLWTYSDLIEELGAEKENFFKTPEELHMGQNTGWRYGHGDDQVLLRPRIVKRKLPTGEVVDAILCDPNVDGWVTK